MISTSHSPLLTAIFSHAECSPDKCAVIDCAGNAVSYSMLRNNILRAAALLAAKGLHRGDRLILSAQKDVEYIYFYFASHLLGIINVVVDAKNNTSHIGYIAEVTTPSLAIGCDVEGVTSLGYQDILSDSQELSDADAPCGMTDADTADVMFTSGTTGNPKGVKLSHANIAASASYINRFIGNGPDDVELLGLPVCHSFGLGRLRCSLLTGATVVLHNGFANLKSVFDTIVKYGVTGFGMVPAIWAYIRKFSGTRIGNYADRIRYIEIGSAAMPLDDKEMLLSLFPDTRICMHYGLTEASRSVFMEFHEESDDLATAGRSVVPEVEIAIFSSEGERLPADSEGEVCVRGKMVTRSYYLPDDNRDAFFGDFFRTGDWGYLSDGGKLYLLARKKELINVGGKKVSPVEIEEALEAAGAAECMVVADKDPILGEVPKALLVEAALSVSVAELEQRMRERLETYKLPRKYEVVDSIPKTASGKKQRLKMKTE